MERLGLRVKHLREARGLSLRDLGNAVGLTPQSVHAWEKGKSAVPSQDVPTIAATLGVRICELYGIDEAHQQSVLRRDLRQITRSILMDGWADLPLADQELIREMAQVAARYRDRLRTEEGRTDAPEEAPVQRTTAEEIAVELTKDWYELPEAERRYIKRALEHQKSLRERVIAPDPEPASVQRES